MMGNNHSEKRKKKKKIIQSEQVGKIGGISTDLN